MIHSERDASPWLAFRLCDAFLCAACREADGQPAHTSLSMRAASFDCLDLKAKAKHLRTILTIGTPPADDAADADAAAVAVGTSGGPPMAPSPALGAAPPADALGTAPPAAPAPPVDDAADAPPPAFEFRAETQSASGAALEVFMRLQGTRVLLDPHLLAPLLHFADLKPSAYSTSRLMDSALEAALKTRGLEMLDK